MREVGDKAKMRIRVVDPACGDHPELLMAERGEEVEICRVVPQSDRPYAVKVVGKPFGSFWVEEDELE